ncbi:MAG: glycosyltransferase family 4 protein [Actinobacteria bacterium]|nr:glycosyltransferase family 4 protein [Actinomycetota bacterium]
MRIGVVSPYGWTAAPGGVNNHITSLVEHLENRGYEAWVIAPTGNQSAKQAPLPRNFIEAGRAFPFKANGSVAHVNVWPLMLSKMERILSRHDFDVVHVHEPTLPAVGAAATMMSRVPVVGTFHAAGEASGFYQRWRPLAERIIASITVRIAVSDAARECVVSHFPGEYRVIPNGIDIGTYKRARSADKTSGRILFIGRAEPRKGLAVLLEAFAELRQRMPEASLVLAGPSWDEVRALLHSKHANPGNLDGVEALGRVPLDEKLEQMRRAEVLCAPSLGGESFGIVLTEALAAGIPVAASDIPGYRAVLAEGAAGVLVPPGDAGALGTALWSLMQNADLRDDLSAAGIVRSERYSWERVVEQVIEAYQDALVLGPNLVTENPVPMFAQMRHWVRTRPKAASLEARKQGSL